MVVADKPNIVFDGRRHLWLATFEQVTWDGTKLEFQKQVPYVPFAKMSEVFRLPNKFYSNGLVPPEYLETGQPEKGPVKQVFANPERGGLVKIEEEPELKLEAREWWARCESENGIEVLPVADYDPSLLAVHKLVWL